jgi:hypothetical protein
MKLSELAAHTGATCNLSDADIEILGAAGLDQRQVRSAFFQTLVTRHA